MNYMPIAPISMLNMVDKLSYRSHVMILAHLLQNKQYKDYWLNTSKYRTFSLLDNGIAEDSQLTPEQLIEYVKQINPTCVVAPDTLFDGPSTIEKSEAFIKLARKHKITSKIMVVPHGCNPDQYRDTLKHFINHKHVQWIGISKFVSRQPYNDRGTCFLDNYDLLSTCKKNIHILGCNNPIEASLYNKIKQVKSIDSCIACLYGCNFKIMPVDVSESIRIPTPHDYFDFKITDDNLRDSIQQIIDYNISIFDKIIN